MSGDRGGKGSKAVSSGSATARATSKSKPKADPKPLRAPRRTVEGDTPKETAAAGAAIRNEVPRSTQGDWAPAADRPDPVAMILEQSANRVASLVPIRHGRMLASPFSFFRGGALIMAADLARTPSSGIYVQCCGDAHVSNFGMFATPERTAAFDVNDFDESHPAPFEWDVMRLAASIVVAGDENGIPRKASRAIAQHAASRYRQQMRSLSHMNFLDVWYSRVDVRDRDEAARQTATKSDLKTAKKTLAKAQRKTNTGALDRLAERVDGQWRIKDEPPLIERAQVTPELRKRLGDFYKQYLHSLPKHLLPLMHHYKVVDFARKVVGVGSVGTQAFVMLLIGTRHGDALFLQLKEADESVFERYTISDLFKQQGERVVFGQRLMQASSDTFLGFASATTKRRKMDFYVRQLNDYKASADIAKMSAQRLSDYVEVCAESLARAHARSGGATAISGYLGKSTIFDKAMGSFAVAYADQNKRDYEAFAAAAKQGRMEVVKGV